MYLVTYIIMIINIYAISWQGIDFYEQFHVLVLGLDSVEARRYMNSIACSFLGARCGTAEPTNLPSRVEPAERAEGDLRWLPKVRQRAHELGTGQRTISQSHVPCCGVVIPGVPSRRGAISS